MLLAAGFLVTVPVFVQAPLVRVEPELSLALTVPWLIVSWMLLSKPSSHLWGDLLLGFSWSWLAGAIYWGWFRWEPLLHLPIEAVGAPLAIWGLARGWGKVGHCFYLGSLFGTAVTDAYCYLVDLIPSWRALMQTPDALVMPVFREAIAHTQTSWGIAAAGVLISILLTIGCLHLRSRTPHWWAFSGAVLSTLLVDGLFWIAAAIV